MSTPSRILTPGEKQRMDEATQTYVAVLEQQLGALYVRHGDTPGFIEWHALSQWGAVINMAVQNLLSPEAYGVPRLPLEPMVRAIGMAIGSKTANATHEEFERLMLMFGEGAGIGRAENHAIAINMPTAGRA